MAKKYQPSGYLIVNLGSLDLSTINTLTDANPEVKSLLEELQKEESKPIWLYVNDTDQGWIYVGICSRCGSRLSLMTINGDGDIVVITIMIGTNFIEVSSSTY